MSKTTNTRSRSMFSSTIIRMADTIIEDIELELSSKKNTKTKTVRALTSDIYTLACAIDIDITNTKMQSKDKISSYVKAIKQTCEMIQGAEQGEQGDCVTYTYIYE